MTIFTRAFWLYAGERSIKTLVQVLAAGLVATGVTGILDVAWVPLLSTAALAGILSVCTSLLAYSPARVFGEGEGRFE